MTPSIEGPPGPQEVTLSEFAQMFVHLRGKPFSFEGYEYFKPVYDTTARGIVLKAARQVSKSTAIANLLVGNACLTPYYSTLYVAPTENHISMFSKQKLETVLASPAIAQYFMSGKRTVDQVFYKKLSTDSDVILRSCFLDAESIRGIACDRVSVDEIQDILVDNIPVIEECYTRSPYKHRLYAGTPKTHQHAGEFYWDMSTQYEWLVRCWGCNTWNYLDERNILPHGLSCAKCHKRIYPQQTGQWVQMNTNPNVKFEGFRISQLMVPWIPWDLADAVRMYGPDADENGTIMYKYKRYSRQKFYNEVIGIPYDNAACPVTLRDLIEACDPKLRIVKDKKENRTVARMNLFAGIDWATGVDSGESYSIITVGGFVPGDRFVVVFTKRYEGLEADPRLTVQDMADIIIRFGIKVVGADWGSGADKNKMLQDKLRGHNVQFLEFNHSGTQKADIAWNKRAKMIMVNRTRIMTEIFTRIQQKDIIFPNWNDMKGYLQDILNIFTDYNEVLRVIFYNHPANKPDDFMHSLIFCHLSATVANQS